MRGVGRIYRAKKILTKDIVTYVGREFDEFRVDTHHIECKLRTIYIYHFAMYVLSSLWTRFGDTLSRDGSAPLLGIASWGGRGWVTQWAKCALSRPLAPRWPAFVVARARKALGGTRRNPAKNLYDIIFRLLRWGYRIVVCEARANAVQTILRRGNLCAVVVVFAVVHRDTVLVPLCRKTDQDGGEL